MQINTLWIRPLMIYTRKPENEVRARLINDACYNIAAAGAILRTYLNEDHGNLMLAIGDYHSHTKTYNELYQAQVTRAAEELFVKSNHH